jgi:hypothetical protein
VRRLGPADGASAPPSLPGAGRGALYRALEFSSGVRAEGGNICPFSPDASLRLKVCHEAGRCTRDTASE